MCARPAGTIADEPCAGSRPRPAVRERIALPLVCLMPLSHLGYALRPNLPVSLLLLLLSGAGAARTPGPDQWFARAVPRKLRGRATTLLTAGLMTVRKAGTAPAGVAAECAGVTATVAGAGARGTACRVRLAVAARRTEERDGADRNMTDR
ncbi:hypothetical protein [Streptomyces thermoalcalitolerans]|uniref:Secreted protein n=1 Tax=Streptomyces thermoalcalitolerans TaxID=65605 RepID=A0ABN1NRZ6_9ACTN